MSKGSGLASLVIVSALWGVVLAVVIDALDGRHARQRRAECAEQRQVWHYEGDVCARAEVLP